MKYVLALDQSTSATKALIFDQTGRLIDKASKEHRQIYPQPGWVEHDAEEIWINTMGAIDAVLSRNEGLRKDLACLSVANQRETVVVFDRETGQPLHHAIVWQCRRGDSICNELAAAGCEEEVRRKTGLKLDSYFSASKLKWLVRHRPEIRRRLEEGSARAGTIDTYLIYRLTQGRTFATDCTNASRTLLYDIGRLAWDERLCELFETPIDALPEVRDNDARFGETTADGRLDAPLPIFGVMGDSQAALFAQRCFEPGMVKVTLGSGSSILLNTGPRLRLSQAGAVSTVAWRVRGETTYCLEGLINYSAATVEWLRRQLGLIRDVRETESLAESVPDNGGVYLVPAFSGLSAPYWSQTARAAILGMTAHTSRNHLVRAALESIAYQIRDVLEMMRREAGSTLRRIQADGGAAANRFLAQFIADIVGVELQAAAAPDFSPLGAALAATLGLGLYDSLDQLAALPRDATTYQPRMERSRADEYYSGWKRAVARLL